MGQKLKVLLYSWASNMAYWANGPLDIMLKLPWMALNSKHYKYGQMIEETNSESFTGCVLSKIQYAELIHNQMAVRITMTIG